LWAIRKKRRRGMKKLDLEKIIKRMEEKNSIVCFETEDHFKEFEKNVYTEKKREDGQRYFIYNNEKKMRMWLSGLEFVKLDKTKFNVVYTSDFLLKPLTIEEIDWEELTRISEKPGAIIEFETEEQVEFFVETKNPMIPKGYKDELCYAITLKNSVYWGSKEALSKTNLHGYTRFNINEFKKELKCTMWEQIEKYKNVVVKFETNEQKEVFLKKLGITDRVNKETDYYYINNGAPVNFLKNCIGWSDEYLAADLINAKNFKLIQFEKQDGRETQEVSEMAIKTELLVKHLIGSEKEGYKEQLVALDSIHIIDLEKRIINGSINNVVLITDLAGNLQSQFGIEPKKYKIEKIDERQTWKTKAMELASLNLDLELKLKEKTPKLASVVTTLEEELKGLSKEVKHTVKWD
jgi:hypothetical protein